MLYVLIEMQLAVNSRVSFGYHFIHLNYFKHCQQMFKSPPLVGRKTILSA
jgi:hypothetical protein